MTRASGEEQAPHARLHALMASSGSSGSVSLVYEVHTIYTDLRIAGQTIADCAGQSCGRKQRDCEPLVTRLVVTKPAFQLVYLAPAFHSLGRLRTGANPGDYSGGMPLREMVSRDGLIMEAFVSVCTAAVSTADWQLLASKRASLGPCLASRATCVASQDVFRPESDV